ncbi:wtf element Wtf9 [Orobanche hederae]
MKNKTCTTILKEAYHDDRAIEPHPLANVRKKYIELMKESAVILRNRGLNNSKASERNIICTEDLGVRNTP